MLTRFDDREFWRTPVENYKIIEMETMHLLNTLRMFQVSPYKIMSMIIKDIENNGIFVADRSVQGIKQSLQNVTNMSDVELFEYALTSECGRAIVAELENRGVNWKNAIKLKVEV